MTPEQQSYCKSELEKLSGTGCNHEAYVIDRIDGLGSAHLCDVSPPILGFSNDGDPDYQQYLHNWDEVNSLIADIKNVAEKAWGKHQNPPEREWIDLTDDEIHSIYKEHHAIGGCWTDGFNYERAVIAAFKAKQGENK